MRPTSVTVFAILNLVFAALGAFGIAAVAALMLSGLQQDPPGLPANTIYAIWTKVSFVISAICLIALGASGIGLLRMRHWGLSLAILYAVVTILSTLFGLVMHVVFYLMPVLDHFAGQGGQEAAAAVGGAIGGVVGGAVGLIYPALLWFFMSRPRVRAAFEAANSADAGNAAADYSAPPPRGDLSNPYSSPTVAGGATWTPQPGDGESVIETFVPSKNGPALASYYLGIFSLLPCFGLPMGAAAVYFGIQGLRRVRQEPAVRGRVHAWVGVICGSLFGLFNLALVALIIVGLIGASMQN